MAIYHLNMKVIGRSSGRSATAAAAYRSGTKITDERSGVTHDYTRKHGVDYSEILVPENASNWVSDRHQLWNEVERVEKRKDAQLAREFDVALPQELSQEQAQNLITDYVQKEFVDRGMVADIALHELDSDNPHAHVMLTTRSLDQNGFGKKCRDWNDKAQLEHWRQSWQDHTNHALEQAGHTERIDCRSLEAQGIDRVPQIHLGAKVLEMEQRTPQPVQTEKGDLALAIEQHNRRVVYRQKEEHSVPHELNRQTQTSAESGRTVRGDSPLSRSARGVRRDGEKNVDRTSGVNRTASGELGNEANSDYSRLASGGERNARRSRSDEIPSESRGKSSSLLLLAHVVQRDGHRGTLHSDYTDRVMDLARSICPESRGQELPSLDTQLKQIQKEQAEERERQRIEREKEAKRMEAQRQRDYQERLERARAEKRARQRDDRDRGFER